MQQKGTNSKEIVLMKELKIWEKTYKVWSFRWQKSCPFVSTVSANVAFLLCKNDEILRCATFVFKFSLRNGNRVCFRTTLYAYACAPVVSNEMLR